MPTKHTTYWDEDPKVGRPLHEKFFAELDEELVQKEMCSELDAGATVADSGVLGCVQKRCTRPFEFRLSTPGSGSCSLRVSGGDGEHENGIGCGKEDEEQETAGSGPQFVWYDGRGDTIYTLPYGIGYFNEVPPDWIGPENMDFDRTGIIAEGHDSFFIIYEIKMPVPVSNEIASSRPLAPQHKSGQSSKSSKSNKATKTSKAIRGNWCPRFNVGPYLIMEWQSRPRGCTVNADGSLSLSRDSLIASGTPPELLQPVPDPEYAQALAGDRSSEWHIHSQTLQSIRSHVEYKWERIMSEVRIGKMTCQQGYELWTQGIYATVNGVFREKMKRETERVRAGDGCGEWEGWFDFEGYEEGLEGPNVDR